jgi:amino acid transporter
VRRTLGLADLVLLGTVAIVNVNTVPPVARFGRATLALWVIAWATFFVPTAVATLELTRRYPAEGGVYVWTERRFGALHGFIAGWCYWINNLLYVPVLLVYLAGVAAYVGGASTAPLVDNRAFVAAVAFGWLSLITVANVRGLATGKWINNAGGIGSVATVVLLVVAAAAARARGLAVSPALTEGTIADMASGLSVMCFAFIGIELASTMAGEIRNPARDLPRAIAIVGAVAVVSYVAVTDALLSLVPAGDLGAIQGVMQAVDRGAQTAGVPWLVTLVAVVTSVAIGGAASAWFTGPARIPFVAGLERALPAALARVHPRWGSPHVALLTCAAVSAAFLALAMVGADVTEAYQILLKATVVINLIPFVYIFLALLTLDRVTSVQRAAGAVGAVVSAVGIAAAFLPDADVSSVVVFEVKMAAGVLAPILLGVWLFTRSRRSAAQSPRDPR